MTRLLILGRSDAGMRVDDLNDLDLSYTPLVSSPWDPLQMSAQSWMQAATACERG